MGIKLLIGAVSIFECLGLAAFCHYCFGWNVNVFFWFFFLALNIFNSILVHFVALIACFSNIFIFWHRGGWEFWTSTIFLLVVFLPILVSICVSWSSKNNRPIQTTNSFPNKDNTTETPHNLHSTIQNDSDVYVNKNQPIYLISTSTVPEAYTIPLFSKICNFVGRYDNDEETLNAIFSSFNTLKLKEGCYLRIYQTESTQIPYIQSESTSMVVPNEDSFFTSFHYIETDKSSKSFFELALLYFLVKKCFFYTWHDGAYNEQPIITQSFLHSILTSNKYNEEEKQNIKEYPYFNSIRTMSNNTVKVNFLEFSNSLQITAYEFTIFRTNDIRCDTNTIVPYKILF